MRVVALVGLGVIAALPAANLDAVIAVYVLAVGVPLNIALRELVARFRFTPWWIPAVDAAMIALAIAIEPRVGPVAAILLLGSASQAATAGWRRTVAAMLLGMPFLLVALARFDVADAGLLVSAYLGTAVGVTLFVSRIADEERRVRRSREELLEGIDAIIWEARPYPFEAADISGDTEEIIGFDTASLSAPGAWLARIPAFDRAEVVRRSRNAIDAGHDHELTYRVTTAAGDFRHIRDRVRVERDGGGRPIAARGVIVDVTDEVRVRESNRNLAELVERVPIGLAVARAGRDDFVTVSVNPAYERLAGRPATELVNTSTAGALTGPGSLDVRELLEDVRRTARPQQRIEAADLQAGGTRILSLEAFPISDDLVGLNVDDVTDRVRTARVLEHQALHDRLTGLPNRALLDDRLRHAIEAAHRDQRTVALILLDLNQFKEVNDTLGHDQGDRLLVMVGERLRRALRAVDTVARLGGDEFAVLLTEEVSPRRTLRAAERVLACFDEPHHIDGMSLQCGASLGVAMYPAHGPDAETLRMHADIAMYAAKRRGGGVAVYDADRDQPNLDRMTLVAQLRHGLDSDEFVLHYQPVIELATARVVRVEALLRWDHPGRGLIGPEEFIGVAEVSGAIRPLTRWVLEQAARDIVELDSAGHRLELAANVSVRNLYEPRFVESVCATVEGYGIEPQRVTLELTETQMMDDPALAHSVLSRLRDFGIRGSVDDFGTGHSSLANLQSLPVHEIKIDRSFVQAMGEQDDAAATIVRSIVSLGQNLGLDVTAEGVETPSALSHLSMLGCDRAQGYLFAPPLSLHDLHDYLDGSRHGVAF